MASPSSQRQAGLAAARNANRGAAQARRQAGLEAARGVGRRPGAQAAHYGHGLGFLTSLIGNTLGDFKDAAVNMPAGVFELGKAQALDTRDLLLHGDVTPERLGGIGKGIAQQTYTDLRHPLRHPGNTLLDVLGLVSAGAGTAVRGGAALGAIGEGADAAAVTRALLHAPKPGSRVLQLGDLTVASPASRSPLVRAAARASDARLMRKAAAEPGGRAYTKLAGKVEKAARRNAHVTDLIDRGQYSALDAIGKKLSPAQQQALRVVAEGKPIEDVMRFHEQRLTELHDTPGGRLEAKRHRKTLKLLHQADERYVKTIDGKPAFRDGAKTKAGHLADVYVKAQKAAGSREQLLEYLGFLSPAAAEARKAAPGRVVGGARYVEPTNARLGISPALDRQEAYVSRLEKLRATAIGRAESRANAAEANVAKQLRKPGSPPTEVVSRTATAEPRTPEAVDARIAELEQKIQPPINELAKALKEQGVLKGSRRSGALERKAAASYGEAQSRIIAEYDKAKREFERRNPGHTYQGPHFTEHPDWNALERDAAEAVGRGDRRSYHAQIETDGGKAAYQDAALKHLIAKLRPLAATGDTTAQAFLRAVDELESLRSLRSKMNGADLFPEDVPAGGYGVDLRVEIRKAIKPGSQSRYRRPLLEAGFSEKEISAGLEAAAQNLALHRQDPAAFIREVGAAATGKQLQLAAGGKAKRLSGRAHQFGQLVADQLDRLPTSKRGAVRGMAATGEHQSASVERIGAALSVAKDDLERIRARVESKVTPTGLIGDEGFANPDGIYVSGVKRPGPMGQVRVATKGVIGEPREPTSFSKTYTGASKLHALEPENVLRAIAQSGLEAQRYGAMLTFRDMIAAAGLPTPPTGSLNGWRFVRLDAGPVSPIISDLIDKAAAGEKLAPQETTELSSGLERVRSHIFTDPNVLDEDQLKQLYELAAQGQGVWVPEKLIGNYNRQAVKLANFIGQKPTSLIDSINNASKMAVLYLKPAYALPNMLGNAALNILQQGFAAIPNLKRAAVLRHAIGPELTARVDTLMGEGFARALAGDAGLGNRAVQKLADIWSTGVDIPFRRSAFIHEARQMGFSSHDQLERLLTSPAHRGDLSEVVRRANREIIDYSELGPVEREVIRRVIFFYPWVKGATKYAGTLLAEHPIKAAAIGQLSQRGKQLQQDTLGPVPSYLEGSFGVGRNGNLLVNPQAAAILSTPAQVGEAIAGIAHGHQPEVGDLSNFSTPALSLLINEISRRNVRLGADYPRSASGADIAYDTLAKGLPQVVLATRIRDALAGRNQDKLFPPSVIGALGQFAGGGVVPRKVNKQKLLALYRKEQTSLKK